MSNDELINTAMWKAEETLLMCKGLKQMGESEPVGAKYFKAVREHALEIASALVELENRARENPPGKIG